MFAALASKFPVVKFVTVDVDECDLLAGRHDVQRVPTVKFFRGKMRHCLATLGGGGPEFAKHFVRVMKQIMTEHEQTATIQARRRRCDFCGNIPWYPFLQKCKKC